MRLAIATMTLVLALAMPAFAFDESMRVNEISVAGGKVELLDVLPFVQPDDLPPIDPELGFSNPDGYAVRSYDGAGNEVAAREYPAADPAALPEYALRHRSRAAGRRGSGVLGEGPRPERREPTGLVPHPLPRLRERHGPGHTAHVHLRGEDPDADRGGAGARAVGPAPVLR
jgi:hypothetical protein